MANKVPMEFSPFVGPDSLRQFLYLSKKLFENHTPRNYGFEDTKGSYYEGTVENWGAEELMESRKLLLNKPSLKNILIENSFDYYFDVKYSGFVNTYDQQNMLCALLKKDVLLSTHTYKLRFQDAVPFSVPRSNSSSDPEVVRDNFIMTLTPPTLIEDDLNEYTLRLTDVDHSETVYFFHLDVETEDFANELDNNVMVTKEIDNSMQGFPMIWMCVDVLNTFPDINFEGNEYGEDDKPFLTIGTNGHDLSFVYPFISLSSEELDITKVIIKVIPSDTGSFNYNTTEGEDVPDESIYETDVREIHFCVYADEMDVHTRPQYEYVIVYDNENTRLTLHRDPHIIWQLGTPIEGDYDYDGTTYRNRTYAYTYGLFFTSNQSEGGELIPAFNLHMMSEYLYPTEYLSLNTYAGAHVDVTSDHSDNDVIKKNGIIHKMGDFDGLPRYFKYDEELVSKHKTMNKKIHRAHVEMYALRDKKNDPYQKTTDKPTAGVIVDSGIPQTEYSDLVDDLPITIRFQNANIDERHFIWTDEPISKTNILSEIVYVDMYHLGNARIFSQRDKKKLIYHGNRHFSLYKTGFDPELEYGRVYIISNDPTKYVNNHASKNPNPKPPRTFARICDIPTEYAQIIGLENLCPTFILDTEYVRTESNYLSTDIDMVWNKRKQEHVIHSGNRYVFDRNNTADYNTIATTDFPNWVYLISYVDLNDSTNVTFTFISATTQGYDIGDEFDFYIGGISVKGRVADTNSGTVTSVLYLNQITGEYESTPLFADGAMNVLNFPNHEVTYDTNTRSGVGEGLQIVININETYYDSLHKTKDGVLPDTIFFYKDEYDVISIYEYTSSGFVKKDQVTGLYSYKNSYDTGRSRKYDLLDSFLYVNMTNNENVIESPQVDVWRTYSSHIYNLPHGDDPVLDPTSQRDLSLYLNMDRVNKQDTYYVLQKLLPVPNPSDPDNPIYANENCLITEFTNNAFVNSDRYTDVKYPDFGDVNLSSYFMKSNVFKYTFNSSGVDVQVYDPNASKKKTINQISNDIVLVTNIKPITYKDIFIENRFIDFNSIIDSQGYLLSNVYAYNEYDSSEVDNYRYELSRKTRAELVELIRSINFTAYPLQYEPESPYQFSKDMLIDYIIENRLLWGPEEAPYTSAPQSIYRNKGISIFEYVNTRVLDRNGNPYTDPDTGITAKQPTGAFVQVIEEVNPVRRFNGATLSINPEFIFRLDGVMPSEINGHRMYDGDIDITTKTMLIINADRYIAKITGDNVSWVKIQRRND